ncbi:MAG: hypothetical protein JW717_14585 [Marinilabiliaceae bacterium]|nr:hypothetical protein [Marinilabiliaceae bacterium]
MRYCYILFLLLLITIGVRAGISSNQLMFQPLTVDQGLPHNYVHSVTQDRKGFLWIGTNYGLARYDGYSFKVFQPNLNKKHSITHKPVSRLFADSKDRLWFAINSGGVNKMDLQTEYFTGYFFDSTGTVNIGFDANGFFEDRDSVIWFASNNGLFKYIDDKDVFEYVLTKVDDRWNDVYINSFADDLSGNIWMVFQDELCILNKGNYKVYTLNEFLGTDDFSDTVFRGVFSNKKGEVWIATERSGLLCVNLESKKIHRYLKDITNQCNIHLDNEGNVFVVTNYPSYQLYACKQNELEYENFKQYSLFESQFLNRYMRLHNDNVGNLWIASAVGFGNFCFDTGFHNYTNIKKKYGLPGVDIEDFFIDRTDNIWLCPYRLGIYKADVRQKPFRSYDFTDKRVLKSEKANDIASVYADNDGNLWLGESDKGISCFNREQNKYYRFSLNTADLITSIYEDSNGYLWLGAYWDHMFRVKKPDLNTISENKKNQFTDIERFWVLGVRDIVGDAQGNIWLASGEGIVEWNAKDNSLTNHSQLYDSLHEMTFFYRTLFIDKDGIIWGGSNNGGLCSYDTKLNRFVHYLHDKKNPGSISSNTVYAIYQKEDGNFLIGTALGVVSFCPAKETFEPLFNDSYLSQRSVFSIFPDTMGNYWMSCDAGVIKFNSITKDSHLYGQADGLHRNEFNTTGSFMSGNGEIFFSGSKGLVSFFPSEIKSNPLPARPVITNFMYFNKVVSPGDSVNGRILLSNQIWDTKTVVLEYDENDFSLEFSALHYSAPEKIVYQYRLSGFNEHWTTLYSNRRWANFTGLPPGEYLFELRATNNDGIMCSDSDIASLLIIVNSPFWLTPWFITLITVFVVALTFIIVRLRFRRLSNQKTQLKRMVYIRTKELAETNQLLEERGEEIETQNEELARANKLLEEQKLEIEVQNEELLKHRNHLEQLVKEQTSDLEKAVKKAEESDRLKSSFLANLSHEIRTPMNAIIGFSNLLNTDAEESERDSFIQIINSNCESLLVLINDIIDISMIEANQIAIHKTIFNLHRLFTEIERSFNLSNTKTIDIVFETIVSTDFELYTDEYRLKQIVVNLLSNAIKFTDNGSVVFGYRLNNEMVEFFVSDTGVGIANEDLDKIFNQFHKKELIDGRLYRGTGIGLSISKSLVELLGGDIFVKSELGEGTVFTFTLPKSK